MEKKIFKSALATVLCLALMFGGIVPGVSVGVANAAVGGKTKKVTIVRDMKNNQSYYIMNPLMLKWYKKFKAGVTKTKIYGKYFERSYPAGVTLKWKLSGSYKTMALKRYVVSVSFAKNMKKTKTNTVKSYKVRGESFLLENLLAGKRYYWRVTGNYRGKTIKSPVYTFKTRWTPRTLKVDGVSNVRDLGGYKVPGGRIKQGMIYRSGNLDQISKAGIKYMNNELGIKKQLDLRRANDEEVFIGKSKSLGAKKYINVPALQYEQFYSIGNDKTIIAKELSYFASKKNYPIVFHCMIGRDRTGTLAFLINALLGVSKKNLYADYEMSLFSVSGCYSYISSKKLRAKFNHMYQFINNKYKGTKLNFSQRTEKYLVEECKVKPTHIKRLRKIMIEPDKASTSKTKTTKKTAKKYKMK